MPVFSSCGSSLASSLQHICTSDLMRLLKWKDTNRAAFIIAEEERQTREWYIWNSATEEAGTSTVRLKKKNSSDVALMSVRRGDLKLNQNENPSEVLLNSTGNCDHVRYERTLFLKVPLPAAWVHGANGRRWRRCPLGRTRGRAGHPWREGCKWRQC